MKTFDCNALSENYKLLYQATGRIEFLTASLNIKRTKTPIELDPLNVISLDEEDGLEL